MPNDVEPDHDHLRVATIVGQIMFAIGVLILLAIWVFG